MGTEIDVFISNYTLVDPEIYQLWIDGYSGSEAVAVLNQGELGRTNGVTLELIASDILDQYRTFFLLEKLLAHPGKLQEQLAFQLEPQTRRLLIEKYYDLDDKVIKELLGKKLSSKHRKDLDEVSEKTGVPLKSCRRQFDNVKRIFKTVEEMSGPTAQNVQSQFCLPAHLAEKYACVVFMAAVRFETGKRRLQHVTFHAWKRCAQTVMDHWTYKLAGPDYYDTEMDKEFLLELREFKGLMEKEKEHKQLVCAALKAAGPPAARALQEADANFRAYSRPLLALAGSVHRPRDMRNLFVELGQLADVARQAPLVSADLERLLGAYARCAADLDVLRDPSLRALWEKYMRVITECILTMFNN